MGRGAGEDEVGDEDERGGSVVGGKSEGIDEGGVQEGVSCDGVFGEEGAEGGVVGACVGGEGVAERGVAGDVVGGGGGVGGVAEDPAEGGAKVEVEFCGLKWGFQEHGESVELGGVVF